MRKSILAVPALPLIWLIACGGDSSDDSAIANKPPGDNPPGEVPVKPPGGPDGPGKPLVGPSHGSTVSLAEDDSRAVVVNTDVGTVSVFAIDWSGALPVITKTGDLQVGAEPVAVVMHPNGTQAFVVARRDQKVVRIDDLATAPKKGPEVIVGSEPTSIAMEPTGGKVWVTNWVDGTLSGITTADMKLAKSVDLNAALVATGLLGAGIASRPALAHPRSLAMTNNGDAVDNDETLYVTEFYAQTKAPLDATGTNADTAKVGLVYKVPLDTLKPTTIEIPALADMGFRDINNAVAGCFPNQLQSIQIQGGFGYVNSICASPRGPTSLSFGPAFAACTTDSTCPGAAVGSCVASKCATNCTADTQCGANGGKCTNNVCVPNPANVFATTAPAVSVIDLGGNKTIATVNLAQTFTAYYNGIARPDDATRRLPLHPLDIGFVPGTVTAYFPASGADAVFRVDFDATYAASTIDSVGDPKNAFINVAPAGVDPSRVGRMPSGIAVTHKTHGAGRFALVANWATRNVSVIDLVNQEVAGLSNGTPVVATSAAMPQDSASLAVLEGKRLFSTGIGRWSYKGQGWASCSSCHTDGLSDNVTWQLGAWHQSPTLESLYLKKDPTEVRLNLWSASLDEPTDHEGAIRGIMGGVGAIVKDPALDFTSRLDVAGQTGLNGSSVMVADPSNPESLAKACVVDDWAKMMTWMKTIRSPRAPSNLDANKVSQGKDLFAQASCQGCHGGPRWTISHVFYTPDPTGTVNNQLKSTSWSVAAQAAGFPAALFPAQTPTAQMMRSPIAGSDGMTCALRPVGTYNVAEPDVGIVELKADGVTPAVGNAPDLKGFNAPSLLGMSVGAPYFHGGQVRTLEAMLSSTFAPHHQAFNASFLDPADPQRADKVSALVHYVLSIDEDKPTVAIPPLGPLGGELCVKP